MSALPCHPKAYASTGGIQLLRAITFILRMYGPTHTISRLFTIISIARVRADGSLEAVLV